MQVTINDPAQAKRLLQMISLASLMSLAMALFLLKLQTKACLDIVLDIRQFKINSEARSLAIALCEQELGDHA